ncbi:MAG: alanine--glyoxylate aminotransferase family protein [Rhodobacteraceae bacterium]|nr:alanine--glyoxylate aminotransferase family protein [Paracoccaceae bacterium]
MSNALQFPTRMLMGPGPSDVHPRVLAAMARPTIGHLDPVFVAMMDEIKDLLRFAFQTKNAMTFPVSGPGSVGMEACFANLLEPGDTAIVCANGVFGGRMKENVERCGAAAVMVTDDWGKPVDPNKAEAAIKANPGAKLLAFVHAETSAGVKSDAAALCGLAANAGMMSVVDAVTSLGGISVAVDNWGADAVYSGTQKCLSCPPGLSPVTFSPRAVDTVKTRKTKVQSWFLDLSLVAAYWAGEGARTYHHTAPVNALFALHEALIMLHEEGLENAWARHAAMHQQLAAGLERFGLTLPVAAPDRLPQLNLVSIPEGIDDAKTRRRLLDEFGLEIGGGLGAFAGKAWRIGLMGQSATRRHVLTCVAALADVLQR